MWLADFLAKEKQVAGVKDEPKEGEASAKEAAAPAVSAEAPAPEGEHLSKLCTRAQLSLVQSRHSSYLHDKLLF